MTNREHQIKELAKCALKSEGICLFKTALLFGAGSFAITVFTVAMGLAKEFFEFMSPFHSGYSRMFLGSFMSAFWMSVYGYFLGAFFAFTYNSIKGE